MHLYCKYVCTIRDKTRILTLSEQFTVDSIVLNLSRMF